MNEHGKINYIEFPAKDLKATKSFFESAFGWSFQDYGPEYVAFSDEGLDGGFYQSEISSKVSSGSALLIFYSRDLESTLATVEAAGGVISAPIYAFPGGRRFHFVEPSGNELAVWSDVDT
jgi:uncharacterized protein